MGNRKEVKMTKKTPEERVQEVLDEIRRLAGIQNDIKA